MTLEELTPDRQRFVHQAARWLSEMSIDHCDEVISGGVLSGQDLANRITPYIYCEITGYAIKVFINLYRQTQNDKYLQLADSAGRFLLKAQERSSFFSCTGAFPHSYHFEKGWKDDYYSFDSAICASGLLDLFFLTGERHFLDSAELAGIWLIEKAQLCDGSFRAMHSVRTGDFVRLRGWDGDCASLHAKNAIALLKLYEATRNDEFQLATKRVLDWALKLQDKKGAFRGSKDVRYICTHAHCYALEGLLYGYYVLQDGRYLAAFLKASKWLLHQRNRDGSLNKFYGKLLMASKNKVTDATSQAVRIWLATYLLTSDEKLIIASKDSLEFIRRMQYSEDSRRGGGLHYSEITRGLFSKRNSLIPTWSTMFALHAMTLFQRVRDQRCMFSDILDELF